MTYEEVKRIRENPTWEDVDSKELKELIDKAVEKQIPKKPIYETGVTVNKCPICNDLVSTTWDYCLNCGQKIDWSDRK